MRQNPLLSIVITSYTLERLKNSFKLLDSIKAQTYPEIETIFVAERSQELLEKVKVYSKEKAIPNITVMFNDGEQSASAARNLGIKEAKGDIIAFVDDDALLSHDWADEMVKTYQDEAIIGVAGAVTPLWEDESMSWLPEEFYWVISCTAFTGWDKLRDTRNAWTTNSSFRREVFDSGEFFHTDTGPGQGKQWRGFAEDEDLTFRVKEKTGKRVIFNPKVKVWHNVYKRRITLKSIANNAYWIGLTRTELKKRYPKNDTSGRALEIEQQLIKRIFTKLFPDILRSVFTRPIIAWRKFAATVVVLFFSAIGYVFGMMREIFKRSPK